MRCGCTRYNCHSPCVHRSLLPWLPGWADRVSPSKGRGHAGAPGRRESLEPFPRWTGTVTGGSTPGPRAVDPAPKEHYHAGPNRHLHQTRARSPLGLRRALRHGRTTKQRTGVCPMLVSRGPAMKYSENHATRQGGTGRCSNVARYPFRDRSGWPGHFRPEAWALQAGGP